MAEPLTKSELESLLLDQRKMKTFGQGFAEGFNDANNSSGITDKDNKTADKNSKTANKNSKTANTNSKTAAESLRMKKAEGLINRDLWGYVKEFGSQVKDNNIGAQNEMMGKMWETAQEGFEHFEDFQDRTLSEAKAHFDKLGFTIESLNDVYQLQEDIQKLNSEDTKTRNKAALRLADKHTLKFKQVIKSGGELSETFGVVSANIQNKGVPAVNQLTRSFREGVEKFFTLGAATAAASKALVQMRNDVKSQMKYGSVYQDGAGFIDRYTRALKMGVDPATFSELNAETRRAALASGSLSGFMDMLGDQHREAFNVIGDTTEATRFLGGMYATLGKRGIKPTGESLKGLSDSFAYMQKVTGMTADQYRGHVDDLMEDENVQLKLRTASNNQERQQIINNTMARMKENVALGMTVDQAKETTKALHRLAGEDPRERFKKAAKLQAAMGAMDVAGGGEASAILRKGARATDVERAQLRDALTRTSEAITATRTGENIGAEFMAMGVLDKTGMQDVLGSSSPFQMQFADSLKVQQGMAESLNNIHEQVYGLSAASYFSDIFSSALVDSPLTAIGSALLSLTGWFMKGPFLVALAMTMAKGKAADVAATGVTSALAGGARSLLPAIGAMLPGLGAMVMPLLVGAGVLAAGTLAYQAFSKDDKKSSGPATERLKTVEFDALERLQMTMQDVANNTRDTASILGRMETTNQNTHRQMMEHGQRQAAETKRNNRTVSSGSSPKSAPTGSPVAAPVAEQGWISRAFG